MKKTLDEGSRLGDRAVGLCWCTWRLVDYCYFKSHVNVNDEMASIPSLLDFFSQE